MPIPASKLARWTNYESAAISSARDTHTNIRDQIERDDSRLNDRGEMRFDMLLQGSYANTTIVHGSGDVDILVRMTNPYHGDTTNLNSRNEQRYENDVSYFDQSYSIKDFQTDVIQELTDIYGSRAVTNRNKAVEIDSSHCSLPLDADVLPCQQYRLYTTYNGDYTDPSNYFEGIRFIASDGTEIVNYPERHMKKGTEKNEEADGNYKETIRMFKNARNRMVELGWITKDDAPSYYIECLLSNVPSEKFVTSDLQARFAGIVSYLQDTNMGGFSAQHGLENLFRRSETQWRQRKARAFVDELARLWHNGG